MLIIRSTNNAPVVKPKIISSTTYDESRYIFFWKCLAMHWHCQLIQSYFLDLEPMLASSQENPQKFVIKKKCNYKPEIAFAPVSATISILGALAS